MKIQTKFIIIAIISNLMALVSFGFINNKIIAFLLSLIIAVIVSVLLGIKISKNTENINKLLLEFATGKGDLSKKLEVNSKDEIGIIAKNMNSFLEELEQIIAKVNVTSKLVAESSINLSTNLKDMLNNSNNENHMSALKSKMEYIAENVNKQTAFSEEAASATTEIAESIVSIHERAEKTKNLALDTSVLAKESESNIAKNLEELQNIETSV